MPVVTTGAGRRDGASLFARLGLAHSLFFNYVIVNRVELSLMSF
jgi:hypothetical protein